MKPIFSPALVYVVVGGLYAAAILWGFQLVAAHVTSQLTTLCGGGPC